MAKPSNLQGSVPADNVDPVAPGIMNHGSPPEDSPVDVFQPIFISSHPAETSVTGALGSVPWQLVSRSQQVALEDKQENTATQELQVTLQKTRVNLYARVASDTAAYKLIWHLFVLIKIRLVL